MCLKMSRNQQQEFDTYIKPINAITGGNYYLYNRMKYSIKSATSMDIIVSFLMESGVKLILKDLKKAIDRGAKVRILTGNYLNITEPQALYLLKSHFGDKIDLRFYNVANKSFHPKAYIFHNEDDSEIYIGSSNISRGALTSSIEWNYRFDKSSNEWDFNYFYRSFEDLFFNHSIVVDNEVLRNYSKTWHRPKALNEIEKTEDAQRVVNIYEPRGAQIEALYALHKTRQEGFDKALVVAATGIGKTYLAAFDSKEYKRVLFVAHREEILKQAAISFKNIRKHQDVGFFYGEQKEADKELVFALVQTLGKKEYLCEEYFAKDAFDYIIIDEFHHAAAGNYKNIMEYFTPKFMLGLTATPERLDSKDVFALCDYNSVYEIRLKEAINKGWLVPFRYYGIYDETVDYTQIEIRNGKYDSKQLEKEFMIHRRAELILKHYLKYNSKSGMGFCTSRNHAEYMAKYFNEHHVTSVAVYSGEQGENAQERNKALSELKAGKVRVVFSVDMFNEGVDVPSIDTVLFLRPTESPTVFLQQLGRGLRKYKDKAYLNVLDFIGNFKKMGQIPFLLSDKNYDSKAIRTGSPMSFEYPDDCIIDFDFRLIDLFKKEAERELHIKERIKEAYDEVKDKLGYRPSRVELFLHMEDRVYQAMKSNAKYNILKDYMSFLNDIGELTDEEKLLFNSIAKDFIHMLETTGMVKSYKMPVLKAFYNEGNVKLEVNEEDIYRSFKAFYNLGSNGVDMLKDKSTSDYKTWGSKEYVSLAKRNPVKFLMRSEQTFFKEKEGYMIALSESLGSFINLPSFKEHFKDTIELRTLTYYKDRFNREELCE